MSSEHYTRCPHCKATFKVNDDQLAAANGQVRCGACMNVFDALAYLMRDDEPSAQTNTAPEKQPDPTSDPESTTSIDVAEGEIFQDDPDEDDSSEMAIELSDTLLELDKNADQHSTHFGSDSIIDDNNSEEEPDESWANKVLEEDDEHDSTSNSAANTRTASTRVEPTMPPISNSVSQPSDSIAESDFDIPDEFDSSNSGAEKIDFYYQEPETVRARGILSRLFIAVGSFALVILLLAQVAWFHYEKLAKYPLVKQAFSAACEHIGCELPELVDLNKIRSHNLVVRSHPTTPNALIIDVVLTNEANFPQDFPRLAMYFSDINDKVIAQQIIVPEDYLSPEVFQSGIMPAGTPIYVSIELEDPGKEAVNYKIRFFPGKSK